MSEMGHLIFVQAVLLLRINLGSLSDFAVFNKRFPLDLAFILILRLFLMVSTSRHVKVSTPLR
jgi:hypothetical protein